MLQRARRSRPLLAAAVIGAALVPLSCGGGLERETVTAPAPPPAAPVAAPEGGEVSDSAVATRVTLCHRDPATGTYTTLSVPAGGSQAHLRHGDTLGPCSTATGMLRGTVLSSGNVVSGATIRACPSGVTTTSAPDGRYSLTSVPAGSVTVRAAHPSFGTATAVLSLAEGQQLDLDLLLSGSYTAPTCP